MLLGLAFGGGSAGFRFGAVKTALVNLDGAAQGAGGAAATGSQPVVQAQTTPNAAGLLMDILSGPGVKDLIDMTVYADAAAARRAVDRGDALVAVIIPKGFSAAAISATGAGASVEVYRDPSQEIGPAVVGGVVQQAVDEFNGARAAAIAAARLAAQRLLDGSVTDPALAKDYVATSAAKAIELYAAAPASSLLSVKERGPQLANAAKSKEPGVTGMVLAGMMIFFMFFGAATAARTILTEQQAGTLQRLFTTPTSHGRILGGKFLLAFLTVLVQSAVLLLVGRFAFRIDWGLVGPVIGLMLVGCAVAAGLALLVTSLARTLPQQGAIGSGVYLVLGLIGGNFTGAAAVGGTMAVMRRLTPNGWLLEGWDTVMRGGGFADIVPQLLVPLAFAAVFFGAALVLMRRRFAT
jgi:ABC-2 type transport system permease protein